MQTDVCCIPVEALEQGYNRKTHPNECVAGRKIALKPRRLYPPPG